MRASPSARYPSSPHATDFVDLYPYESFIQSHLETTYLHGRLGLDGTYAMPLSLTYRYSDSLLVDLKCVALGGAFSFPTDSSGTGHSPRCG